MLGVHRLFAVWEVSVLKNTFPRSEERPTTKGLLTHIDGKLQGEDGFQTKARMNIFKRYSPSSSSSRIKTVVVDGFARTIRASF